MNCYRTKSPKDVSAEHGRSISPHHAGVDLTKARRAEDVEEQLLLDAGSHPQEEVEPRLQEVNSAFGQPLLRVPHCHGQRPAFQLHLQSQQKFSLQEKDFEN